MRLVTAFYGIKIVAIVLCDGVAVWLRRREARCNGRVLGEVRDQVYILGRNRSSSIAMFWEGGGNGWKYW